MPVPVPFFYEEEITVTTVPSKKTLENSVIPLKILIISESQKDFESSSIEPSASSSHEARSNTPGIQSSASITAQPEVKNEEIELLSIPRTITFAGDNIFHGNRSTGASGQIRLDGSISSELQNTFKTQYKI